MVLRRRHRNFCVFIISGTFVLMIDKVREWEEHKEMKILEILELM